MMVDIARLGIEVDSRQVKTATADLDRLNSSSGTTTNSLKGLGAAMAALATAAIAKQAIDMADSYTKLSAQLSLASKNANEYSKAMSDVRRISTTAQSDISATAQLYAKLNLALAESGKSQAEVARITETVSLGLKINGAGAQETASAMLQLSQAFGSGVLRGEEFNAMAEASPNLLKALASSMGIPFGQLRELAAQGAITSDVLTKAFADPALLEVYRTQAKEVQTVGGAMTVMGNQITLAVGELMNSSGVISSITILIQFFGDSFVYVIDNGIKPFIFAMQAIGIVISDTIAQLGIVVDFMTSPSMWNTEGIEKYSQEMRALDELTTQMLTEAAGRISGGKEATTFASGTSIQAVETVSKEERKAIDKAARERQAWADYVLAYETDLIVERYNLEQEEINRIAELKRETADAIAGSIMTAIESGNPSQALMQDIEQAFAEKVIKVKVSSAVEHVMESTGKAFDSLLVAIGVNTAATEKNTAESSSGGDWIMAIVAAIYYGFAIGEQKREAGRRTELSGGRNQLTGATMIDWEQSQGWFDAPKRWSEGTNLSLAQINKFQSAVETNNFVFNEAGDSLGYLNTRTKDYTISINTSGDATDALTNSIGRSLVPAIVMFRQEGETLADTATRLTGVFKATSDFITALGVSQKSAFGGFGLGSAEGRQALIDASGGLQQFTANAQGFVNNFLTPAQRLAPALDEVGRTFAQLGIEGINTNEQFAALVKQQTELGNTSVVAELLSVSDSFNSITKSAAEANAQIKALLNKERFSTLVDYQRALAQGSSIASQQISDATALAGGVMAQEARGTRQFAMANRGAIAGQNAALIAGATSGTGEGGQGQWSFFTDWLTRLRELFHEWSILQVENTRKHWEHIWLSLTGWIGDIWNKFKDFLDNLWNIFRNLPANIFNSIRNGLGSAVVSLRELPDNIFNAIRDAFSNLYVTIRDAISDGLSGITSGISGGAGSLTDQIAGVFGWAKGGAFSSTGITPFADGGAFTNNMYSSPTPFMFANGAGFAQGVMGEAGPEAVMPLSRAPNGKLGVSADLSFGALIAEIRALRNDLMSGQFAIALNTKQTFKLLDRWDGQGMPEVREAA